MICAFRKTKSGQYFPCFKKKIVFWTSLAIVQRNYIILWFLLFLQAFGRCTSHSATLDVLKFASVTQNGKSILKEVSSALGVSCVCFTLFSS